MTFLNKCQHDYHLKYSLTSRATVIGCNDTLIVAFIICSLSKLFKVFPSPAVLLFLSRLCKIPSADFCSQQIFFLSADSISKFLSVSRFVFVSKCPCRPHGNAPSSVLHQPVSCRESFCLRLARILLLSQFHSFCGTFLGRRHARSSAGPHSPVIDENRSMLKAYLRVQKVFEIYSRSKNHNFAALRAYSSSAKQRSNNTTGGTQELVDSIRRRSNVLQFPPSAIQGRRAINRSLSR